MNDNTKSMIVVGIVLLLILIPFIYVIISLKNTNNSINGHPISGSDTDSKMMNNMHGNQQTSDDGLNKDIQEIKFRDAVGKKAPDFILKNQDGGTFKLSDNIGKKDIILFLNEWAMCYPACWQQIAALGKDERLRDKKRSACVTHPCDSANFRFIFFFHVDNRYLALRGVSFS